MQCMDGTGQPEGLPVHAHKRVPSKEPPSMASVCRYFLLCSLAVSREAIQAPLGGVGIASASSSSKAPYIATVQFFPFRTRRAVKGIKVVPNTEDSKVV